MSLNCPAYSTSSTAPIGCGPINACPGDVIEISGCDACTGDQYLMLDNAVGAEVTYNDDGCSSGPSICSAISYTVPATSACQDYTIQQSCYAGGSCGGMVSYSIIPAPAPPPSCPAYTATGGVNVPCGPFEACPGDSFEISGCNMCTGDQTLKLTDDSGIQVAVGDDECGTCASFTYVVPATSFCQNFTIEQSCFGGACSGTVTHKLEPANIPTDCAPFSITSDQSANCGPILACPGEQITISTCDTCTGYEWMNLFDSTSNYAVAQNDNGCGPNSECSAITYIVPDTAECQYYNIAQNCYAGVCTGTTVFTVGQPTTVSPTKDPTATPTIAPSLSSKPTIAAASFVEFFASDTCSGTAAKQGAVNGGQCVATDAGYLMVACDPSTSATAWTAAYYATSTCSGAPMSTASGSDPCVCTPLNGMNVYVNCAGVPSNCGGSSSSSELSSGAVAGIVVGVVGFCGLSALAAAYFLGFFKASAAAATHGTGVVTASPMQAGSNL